MSAERKGGIKNILITDNEFIERFFIRIFYVILTVRFFCRFFLFITFGGYGIFRFLLHRIRIVGRFRILFRCHGCAVRRSTFCIVGCTVIHQSGNTFLFIQFPCHFFLTQGMNLFQQFFSLDDVIRHFQIILCILIVAQLYVHFRDFRIGIHLKMRFLFIKTLFINITFQFHQCFDSTFQIAFLAKRTGFQIHMMKTGGSILENIRSQHFIQCLNGTVCPAQLGIGIIQGRISFDSDIQFYFRTFYQILQFRKIFVPQIRRLIQQCQIAMYTSAKAILCLAVKHPLFVTGQRRLHLSCRKQRIGRCFRKWFRRLSLLHIRNYINGKRFGIRNLHAEFNRNTELLSAAVTGHASDLFLESLVFNTAEFKLILIAAETNDNTFTFKGIQLRNIAKRIMQSAVFSLCDTGLHLLVFMIVDLILFQFKDSGRHRTIRIFFLQKDNHFMKCLI